MLRKSLNYNPFGIKLNTSGFTLLEVMVSLSIIAIALTVLLTSQSQSLSLASEAKFNTTAPLLAQSKVAEINIMSEEDLYSGSGDFGEAFPGYYWEMEINTASLPDLETYAEYLKQIDLVVYFGDERKYQYGLKLYRFFPNE